MLFIFLIGKTLKIKTRACGTAESAFDCNLEILDSSHITHKKKNKLKTKCATFICSHGLKNWEVLI